MSKGVASEARGKYVRYVGSASLQPSPILTSLRSLESRILRVDCIVIIFFVWPLASPPPLALLWLIMPLPTLVGWLASWSVSC